MPMKFMIDQIEGTVPKIQPGPTKKHSLLMNHDVDLGPVSRKKKNVKLNQTRKKRKLREMRISMERLLRMRESGASWPEMERASGLGRKTIKSRLADAGHDPMQSHRRIPEEAVRRAVRLRKSGASWNEIERITKHSSGGLRSAINRMGL